MRQSRRYEILFPARSCQRQEAQSLGYSQLFYILGNAVGLAVSVVDVVEPAAGPLTPDEEQTACIIGRCDSTCLLVDLANRFVSKPFVFQNTYAAAGNYWQRKQKENPLEIPRRIQVLSEGGIIGLVYNSLGNGYWMTGQPDQAISYLTKAIVFNPKCAEAFCNRGTVYASVGQTQPAGLDFDQAIKLNPNFAEAYYRRGTAYYALGQNQQALLDYNKAIELNPKYARAFYGRANVYGSLGQNQEAIADYTRAIELDPKDASAFTNRGIAYDALGQHEQAILDFTKAIDLDPNFAAAYGDPRHRLRRPGKIGPCAGGL